MQPASTVISIGRSMFCEGGGLGTLFVSCLLRDIVELVGGEGGLEVEVEGRERCLSEL